MITMQLLIFAGIVLMLYFIFRATLEDYWNTMRFGRDEPEQLELFNAHEWMLENDPCYAEINEAREAREQHEKWQRRRDQELRRIRGKDYTPEHWNLRRLGGEPEHFARDWELMRSRDVSEAMRARAAQMATTEEFLPTTGFQEHIQSTRCPECSVPMGGHTFACSLGLGPDDGAF